MNEQVALQNALRSRLENLRVRYPAYSVRAFAKKAGISAATLSLILQGKRKVSRKLAQQLSERLLFDPQERAEVVNPFFEKKNRPAGAESGPEYVQLSMDQYRLISDWRAFAILNLIKTKSFKYDFAWMARRLAISVTEVAETIDRLKRLEMVEESEGTLLRRVPQYRTTEDVANLSLRKSHQQTLELAQVALENEPVERRDFTWVTFAFDIKKLLEAKTMIRKFQDDLLTLVAEGAEPDEVYRLAIQLFPLTKNEELHGDKK